jgi:hypothetical protein
MVITIQIKKATSNTVYRAYREVALQAAIALEAAGVKPGIISIHIRIDHQIGGQGEWPVQKPWHFRVAYPDGKEPIVTALEFSDITHERTEQFCDLGLSGMHLISDFLYQDAPMMSFDGTLQEYWNKRWLSDYAGK